MNVHPDLPPRRKVTEAIWAPPKSKLWIYLPENVASDVPIAPFLVAMDGWHKAATNAHGAVYAILPNGKHLGIKPREYSHWAIRQEE